MALNVYYSVNPYGTGDLKTGTPDIEITSGVATFSVAQTGNIGVGCRVTYDGHIAYISGVTSSTVFSVVTALGAAPADHASVAVTSIAHEYTFLSVAEAGATDANHINNTDLTAADIVCNICCYYDHSDQTADTTAVTIDGWTTDATRYINIYTPTGGTQSINSQRHSGVWDDTKYRLTTSSGNGIAIQEAFTRIEGLQITAIGTSARGVYVYVPVTSRIDISRCIIGQTTVYGIYVGGGTVNVINTVEYHSGGPGFYSVYDNNQPVVKIYSSSFSGNATYGINSAGATRIAKNVYCGGNTTADWAGYGSITDVTCASSDATATGTAGDNIAYSISTGTRFTNITAGTEDFHLQAGSELIDVGTDTSGDAAPLNFTTDIDGETRPTGAGTWDIGADEYVAAGGVTGDGTATQVAQIASATGIITKAGTSATQQTAQSATAAGIITKTGVAAGSQISQEAAAVGTVGWVITGTGAATQLSQTANAEGILTKTGTGIAIQTVQTSTSIGTITKVGEGVATQPLQTAAGIGSNTKVGEASAQQITQSSTAIGTIAKIGAGIAEQIIQSADAVGTIGYAVTGTGTAIQTSQSGTATGVVTRFGTSAAQQTTQSAVATGVLTKTGTAAGSQIIQSAFALGTAGNAATGIAAAEQTNHAASAIGTVTRVGISVALQSGQTASTLGTITKSGTATTDQIVQSAGATGAITRVGVAVVEQIVQDAAAIGTAGNAATGSGVAVQTSQSASATGVITRSGTSAATQVNQIASAIGIVTKVGISVALQSGQTSQGIGYIDRVGTVAAVQEIQSAIGLYTGSGVTGPLSVSYEVLAATVTYEVLAATVTYEII